MNKVEPWSRFQSVGEWLQSIKWRELRARTASEVPDKHIKKKNTLEQLSVNKCYSEASEFFQDMQIQMRKSNQQPIRVSIKNQVTKDRKLVFAIRKLTKSSRKYLNA